MINFVALDLETANGEGNGICQVGITEVIDGIIQPSKNWLVQPEGNKYNPINSRIHGIKPEDTEHCPKFPLVWEEVCPFLMDKIVVAHNASSDMTNLRKAFDFYQMGYPTFDYFCTYRIAKYVVRGCEHYSLDELLKYLGIEFWGHHKADEDSLGCAKLLLKCLEIEGCTLEELETKYNFHRGKFAPNTFVAQTAGKSDKGSNYNPLKNLEEHSGLEDKDSYFYGKNVCFTGQLTMSRQDLLQKIKDIGGIPTDKVTKKTDILIVGQQDERKVDETGMSSKHKKALSLMAKGQNIEIFSEQDFLNRI